MVFGTIDPFGEERADLRAGIIASTIANINRPKNRKVLKPQEFMPKFEHKTQQDAGDILAFFKILDNQLNGNDN